jgi:hypothetical protein
MPQLICAPSSAGPVAQDVAYSFPFAERVISLFVPISMSRWFFSCLLDTP